MLAGEDCKERGKLSDQGPPLFWVNLGHRTGQPVPPRLVQKTDSNRGHQAHGLPVASALAPGNGSVAPLLAFMALAIITIALTHTPNKTWASSGVRLTSGCNTGFR